MSYPFHISSRLIQKHPSSHLLNRERSQEQRETQVKDHPVAERNSTWTEYQRKSTRDPTTIAVEPQETMGTRTTSIQLGKEEERVW